MRAAVPAKLEAGRVRTGRLASDASFGLTGCFEVLGPCCGQVLRIIASDGDAGVQGGMPWEHVSVSLKNRCPNWPEMCFVKDLFWGEEETVVQYHPSKSDYVNVHTFCLHMWRPLGFEIPRPPSVMVGSKAA